MHLYLNKDINMDVATISSEEWSIGDPKYLTTEINLNDIVKIGKSGNEEQPGEYFWAEIIDKKNEDEFIGKINNYLFCLPFERGDHVEFSRSHIRDFKKKENRALDMAVKIVHNFIFNMFNIAPITPIEAIDMANIYFEIFSLPINEEHKNKCIMDKINDHFEINNQKKQKIIQVLNDLSLFKLDSLDDVYDFGNYLISDLTIEK